MTMVAGDATVAAGQGRPTVAYVLSRANPPQLGPTLEQHFKLHGLPDGDAIAGSVAGFAGGGLILAAKGDQA